MKYIIWSLIIASISFLGSVAVGETLNSQGISSKQELYISKKMGIPFVPIYVFPENTLFGEGFVSIEGSSEDVGAKYNPHFPNVMNISCFKLEQQCRASIFNAMGEWLASISPRRGIDIKVFRVKVWEDHQIIASEEFEDQNQCKNINTIMINAISRTVDVSFSAKCGELAHQVRSHLVNGTKLFDDIAAPLCRKDQQCRTLK